MMTLAGEPKQWFWETSSRHLRGIWRHLVGALGSKGLNESKNAQSIVFVAMSDYFAAEWRSRHGRSTVNSGKKWWT